MKLTLSPDAVEVLLGKLCVFIADGMDPAVADSVLYRQVLDCVTEAFQQAQAKADSE